MSSYRLSTAATVILILAAGPTAHAQQGRSYDCLVTSKLNSDGYTYSAEDLKRGQFSVRVTETSSGVATISRCSFVQRLNQVTCDPYLADHVSVDSNAGLRKYYVFGGQFDVQIFSSGHFVENNGRGGLAFGNCTP